MGYYKHVNTDGARRIILCYLWRNWLLTFINSLNDFCNLARIIYGGLCRVPAGRRSLEAAALGRVYRLSHRMRHPCMDGREKAEFWGFVRLAMHGKESFWETLPQLWRSRYHGYAGTVIRHNLLQRHLHMLSPTKQLILLCFFESFSPHIGIWLGLLSGLGLALGLALFFACVLRAKVRSQCYFNKSACVTLPIPFISFFKLALAGAGYRAITHGWWFSVNQIRAWRWWIEISTKTVGRTYKD